MAEKTDARSHEPKCLTASEIRCRVEDIAEELALKLRVDPPGQAGDGLEAFPLDTRKFVLLMSNFVRMN